MVTPRADLFRALATLGEPPQAGHAAIAEALGLGGPPDPEHYAAVFLFGAFPYASVYVGAEGMLGGEARDRVAGFWRALGLVPPPEPDHVAALLGLYAAMIEREDHAAGDGDLAEAAVRSTAALLWEHLLSWTPPFLDKVAELGRPFYADWAVLLRQALEAEARAAGAPSVLPLHLRTAVGLPDGHAGGEAWMAAILAPVRSGLVLTRWDLRRTAVDLGMGSRVGERAFMLRSLFEQDPRAVADWLAGEARRTAVRHQAWEAALGPVGAFWRRRAEACELALRTAA